MKKIIINADDFGYSTAVNLGIIESFKKGVLTSATLMANMPGCDEAIELAKENPSFGVGGHLVLTCGRPIHERSTLVDKDGKFFGLSDYKLHRYKMDDSEIFEEWCSQIDYLMNQGIKLTHLDSHHHVHTFTENLEITKRIAEKYQICFRNAYGLEEQLALPYQKNITGFLDLMNYQHIRSLDCPLALDREKCFEEIQTVLDQIEENEVTELMVHPAFVDEHLYFNSSFSIQRTKEVAILCDPQMETLLNRNQIETCHYGELLTPVS